MKGDGAKADPNLVEVNLTTDVLTQVYLGMCPYNQRFYDYSCTTPGAKFTDFNVWVEELPDQDMKDWTACKQVPHAL